ncbi:MAG: zinc ribbon domain-containing protein [Promethearchaeota archaeon]
MNATKFENLNQQRLVSCPHCKKNVPNTVFCISCGKKIDSKSQAQEIETSETEKCPLCRKEVPSDHNFCHLCGARLKKKIMNGQDENVLCNRCWKPNPTGTDYCIHCGANRQVKRSKLLMEPFEGFQLDLSHFFQPVSVPLSTLRQTLISSKDFPLKSTISYSKYFGVTKTRKASSLFRNLGGFDRTNMIHYFGTMILILLIYIFWFQGRYGVLVEQYNPVNDGILAIFFGGVYLTSLLMIPLWLSTFMVYRNTGYRLNYRLDSSRIFITIIFNLLWIIFPFFGPIILQLGDFKDPQEHVVANKSFIRGIAWGSVLTINFTLILALMNLFTIGFPGLFTGFLFQDSSIKIHLLTSYFGATWISLIILLPFGDYFDKVIKRWNQVGYLILLAIGLLLLTHSFNLMGLLNQNIYRV